MLAGSGEDTGGDTGDATALEHVVVVPGAGGPATLPELGNGRVRWHEWSRALTESSVDRDELDRHAPGPDSIAQLLFTSGTSGEPKGVPHRHVTLNRAADMEIRHLGLTSRDTVWIPSPLAHQTGFLYGMWVALRLGVPQLVQPMWDPRRGLELIETHRASFVQAATPFLADLVQAVENGAPKPPALRVFVATGAAVPRGLAERATRLLDTAVCGAFGTTETCLGALSSPADPPEKRWGTDGRPLAGIKLRIVDPDGHVLPPGTEGSYELHSPTMFEGYLDRPDLTAEAFTPDGWYRTGDLGVVDEDGYLRITGRLKDVINRGAEKIPVAEIENLLYEHPSVADVAIVAMPDPRLGERACAFVALVGDGELDFPAMQKYLDSHQVAKQYWPERLEVVDALPRNPAGKVQKFLLRERAAKLTAQRDS